MRAIFKRSAFILVLISASVDVGSVESGEYLFCYDLTSPDAIHELPAELGEISGLTYVNPNTILCVQDEHGILYTYDPETDRVTTQVTFAADGDYEGIARTGNTLYVLRSDGAIVQILDYTSDIPEVHIHETEIPSKNNEGLCYDAAGDRLLIAAKSKSGKGSEHKDKRMIYEFDIAAQCLAKEPAFTFDLNEITRFAENKEIDIPKKKKKKSNDREASDPLINLRASTLSIHPLTGRLYLLSAANHIIMIINMDGTVEHMERLDPIAFNQAEGLTFNEKGDLFISNEAAVKDNKPATILRFNFPENLKSDSLLP